MGKDDSQEKTKNVGEQGVATGGRGPLNVVMPPDKFVLIEARKLVADPGTRIEDLAVCIGQDPVLVVELLKAANAMFFSGGRAAITSAKTATIRLGNTILIELFDRLKERTPIEDPEVSHWFEIQRTRSRRASIVATILGEAMARTIVEDCQVASLLQFAGDMLAVAYLEDDYVRLATEVARGSMNYRLLNDHKFDVEKMGLAYLVRQGVPDGILFVLDREARPRQAERAIMRPICHASAELVDAFDVNRIEKFAPGKNLPPKSAVRSLPCNEQQYLKIYERVAEFLFSFRMMEEKRRKIPQDQETSDLDGLLAAESEPQVIEVQHQSLDASSLDDEINQLISGSFVKPSVVEATPSETPAAVKPRTIIAETARPLGQELKDFSLLKNNSEAAKKIARVTPERVRPLVEPPRIHTPKGSKYLAEVSSAFAGAKSSEELIAVILAKLVKPEGPFEKAALMVVSKDRKQALVVAARGPNLGNGQRIEINDPLNPLAQCFSRVQSFGREGSQISPFGSRSFAVAPLDAAHDTPVALYADCGDEGSLTFEARRIFRNVVELLNARLPELPGGIPNELS